MTTPQPPSAPRRPTVLRTHDDERIDDWYWLRDRDDPAVVEYLRAENEWCEADMAATVPLQERLFAEMVARIQETDSSLPAVKDGWAYYSRTVEGLQYPIHCRRRDEPGAPEEVILDENEEAAGHEFYELGPVAISPDHRLLAWTSDVSGEELFDVHVKDLATGALLPDVVEDVGDDLVFALDNATIFYTTRDDAMRPYRVHRHVLGTPVDDDVVVYQEDDERFDVAVDRTKSDRFLVLTVESAVTSEVHVLEADDPTGAFRVVEPRRQGVEYDVEHLGDRFYILTNADGRDDFALLSAPVETPDASWWTPVLPYQPGVRLLDLEVFDEHLVVFERAEGLRRARIAHLAGDATVGDVRVVQPLHDVATLKPGENPSLDTPHVRLQSTSLVAPTTTVDEDLRTGERVVRRREPVLGGFAEEDYVTERLWAVTDDGTRVPISAVRRRDTPADGSAPGLLYGYGSYEASIDPTFSSLRLSLVDRGFVFAIAHVRGGGEMGRAWYEDGKLLAKPHSFTDFVACALHLQRAGLVSPTRLVARGRSAGGLLMGAVANLRPDLFAGIVAEVPFVDCLTTILDDSLPLTVGEWEEWGNPAADPEIYRCMRGYSPYDNVEAKAYPPMLVTGGLNDPRVSYWEPAKWVAKLRTMKTDTNPLLLKTDLGSGHHGPSGRYDAWREEAFVDAFILRCVGIDR